MTQTTAGPTAPSAASLAVLALLLAAASGSAMAEWVAIGGDEGSIVYVDPATVLKLGEKAKMWHLVDYNGAQLTATGRQYVSQKLQYEYDCREVRARLLTYLSHSRNMGAGGMVEGDFHPQKWSDLPQGSALYHLRKYACTKR